MSDSDRLNALADRAAEFLRIDPERVGVDPRGGRLTLTADDLEALLDRANAPQPGTDGETWHIFRPADPNATSLPPNRSRVRVLRRIGSNATAPMYECVTERGEKFAAFESELTPRPAGGEG